MTPLEEFNDYYERLDKIITGCQYPLGKIDDRLLSTMMQLSQMVAKQFKEQ